MVQQHSSQLAIFDFDGTVADTWRDIATALNRTLDAASLPAVEGPDVRFWIGDGALKLLERAVPAEMRGERELAGLFEIFRVHYDSCCLDTTETYPGIIECLEALDGFALAIASNKPARFLDRIVEGLGLKGYFGVVIGGDSLDVRKPDPAVVRHVVDRFGQQLDTIWLIGDSAIDVQTGQNAGANTIGCCWGLRGRAELRRAAPDYLIESATEIAPIIFAAVSA